MPRKIPTIDLMFLLTETPNSPKHVGALLLFDRPQRGGADIVARLVRAYRAATPVAPFNCVPEMIGTRGPQWRPAGDIDLGYHVQHLVVPPDTAHDGLLRLVADLHEPMLDRNRPLFRVWAIDGLPDGRFALYLKMHHAIVDGISAMMRITASMSAGSRRGMPPPFFAVEVARPAASAPAGALRRLADLNAGALRQGSALRDVSLGAIRKGLGRLLQRPQRGSLPFSAAGSPMNQPIRSPRNLATLSLPLDAMRAAGKAFGGTLNDVVVTIVDAGIHAYLKDIGHPARRRVVAMCPISLRASDDRTATTQASIMFVPMGEPAAAIDARLAQVVQGMTTGKEELRAMTKDAALTYGIAAFGLGEVAVATRLDRVAGRLANVVISNVPGARDPLFLGGARMAGMYPVSALGAGIGLNVTVASNAGAMDLGFVANGMALPDMPQLARRVAQAFAELEAAGRRGARKSPGGSRPARTRTTRRGARAA